MKPDASKRKSGAALQAVLISGKGGAGSVQRSVLLRGLRARQGYARRRQRHKLCNANGWLFWEGQIVVLEKLMRAIAQENDPSSPMPRQ